MTENEAKQAIAYCAVLDFSKESHFMRRLFPDKHEIVVYTIAPLAERGEHAVVMQFHTNSGQPRADFYTEFNSFKEDLGWLVADQTKSNQEVRNATKTDSNSN